MPLLRVMPPITIDKIILASFGSKWRANGGCLRRTPPRSSTELGQLFDKAVANSLSKMLGDIPIREPNSKALTPPEQDCVELGNVRVIGGVRPQNFDVGYRPDGPRFAFDSKTLNDKKSIKKNWQNMINDIATEATTVHTRFPHAVVAFIVIYPEPCVADSQRKATIETLERMAKRVTVNNSMHMAEAISLVLWNPDDGTIDPNTPEPQSPLRLEFFSQFVETVYVNRYKGLPPHATD